MITVNCERTSGSQVVMDGGLTRDLNNLERRHHSPSTRANACRQRSVKRKYDSVSLDAPRNIALGNAGLSQSSSSSEVAQDTISRLGHRQSSFRERPGLTRITVDGGVVDEGYSEHLDDSEMVLPRPHLRGPFLSVATLDTKDLELDVERSHANQDDAKTLLPMRTRGLRKSRSQSQTCHGVCHGQDSASDREIVQLRQALKSEKQALGRLYVDLEEERCASATAANEAMAMISRLQEEKAAILMEAHQYRRVAEEREVHNQEAIALLKEIVINKEDDLSALQDQIIEYQTMFLRIECDRLGPANDQASLLEGPCKEGSFFLEGQTMKLLPSCLGSNNDKGPRQNQMDDSFTCVSRRTDRECQSRNLEAPASKTSNRFNPLAPSGVRMNIPGFYYDTACQYDENQVENRSVWNMGTGQCISGSLLDRTHSLYGNTCWDRQRFEEPEMVDLTSSGVQGTVETYNVEADSGSDPQEHILEDENASILARVKRLEERFQDLGKAQAYESQGINSHVEALPTHVTIIGDVESEETGCTGQASDLGGLYDKSKTFSEKVHQFTKQSFSDKGVEDLENGVHGENLQRTNPDRSAPNRISNLRTYRLDVRRATPTEEDICIENELDPGFVHDVYEVQHDVYEVQHDVKETILHHSECVIRDGLEKQCVTSINNLQESITTSSEHGFTCTERLPIMASKHKAVAGELEDYGPETDELSYERRSPIVNDTRKNSAEEGGVYQLKVRLGALESERVFMSQAIESLRKENAELKLLQEIAQQLRELKGDVKKTGQLEKPPQQDQLSILSFLKGMLSFTGKQSSAEAEGNRFFCPFQRSLDSKVSKYDNDGLFHLLEKPRPQTSAFVTRRLKLRLPGSDETGSLPKKSFLLHAPTI